MKQYRFAILSAGNIADIMADTLSRMKGELIPYAIGARDKNRAQKMAEKYGFQKSYGSYEELVADEQVDVVYVASPHSHHYEHVKLCLNSGKHVLCEKAFTANAAQARELVELAEKKNRFLGEAVWTRFMPFVPKLRKFLDDGVIGEIHSVQCAFGQNLLHVERMVDPALAGGALLDLGIYPLTLSSIVLGTDIQNITSDAVISDRGVDVQNSMTIRYRNGSLASLSSCMAAKMPNDALICGEKGFIRLKSFWMCQQFTIEGENEPVSLACPFEISGYEYEVRATIRALDQGKLYCDEMPWEESIRLMEVMDGLRAQWGVKYPFEK